MRKIHESDIQPVATKNIYLFIGISVAFAVLSLAADLLLFFESFGNFNSEYETYFLLIPLIGSFIGLFFGILAKDIARNYLAVSKQGCLAEVSIYLNIIVFALYFFSLCAVIYVAPLAD